MARTMWKGAISFGLLHAPVALYPASQADDIDFDWLTRDKLQPVGYKRVIKETGKEVDKDNIVKGIKQSDGRYVVLSDEEIKSANVKSTHTVDLVAFTDAQDLSFLYFETPYFVAPTKGGEKVYALLREALLKTKKIGVALVVLHNKQHLAALIPTPNAIVLNTLRWAGEVKNADDLDLPPEGIKATEITSKELTMATQLIENMSEKWDPAAYKDTFRDDIMKLVAKKIEEGKAEVISDVKVDVPEEEAVTGANLADLLKRSLQGSSTRPPRKTASKAKAIPKRSPPARAPSTRVKASKTTH